MTAKACLLGALDATVEEKGEGGEVMLAFDLSGPVLDEAHRQRRPYSAAALHRLASAPEDERDRADYQTIYRARGGRGRGTHRRPPFHAGAVRRARRSAASNGIS